MVLTVTNLTRSGLKHPSTSIFSIGATVSRSEELLMWELVAIWMRWSSPDVFKHIMLSICLLLFGLATQPLLNTNVKMERTLNSSEKVPKNRKKMNKKTTSL